MADLAGMKQLAASQGATAPPNYPGGPDQWVQDWYANAVKAGSINPNLGQSAATPGTQEQQQTAQQKSGTYADDSADAGNAKTGDPYLDELRSGKVAGSEDWRRFSNAQLKAWQQYYVGGGKFKNAYGDIVDKPDDVGPNTPAGYNGTGDYIGGGGGGQANAGPSGTAAAAAPATPDYYNPDDPLQAKLMELMQSGGGNMAGINAGSFTQGGGAMWSTPSTPGGATTPTATAATQPSTPSPAPAPSTPSSGPGNAALMSATLNAFATPQTSAGAMIGGASPDTSAKSTAAIGSPASTPPSAAVVPPVNSIVAGVGGAPKQQQVDPNAWWKQGPQVM